MGTSDPKASIFSHKLDRAAFTAYFLGAVVPLVALAIAVQRFAIPSATDPGAALGWIGVVVSIGVLSLASFLVLRRVAKRSLGQMDADNARLAALLRVSTSLGKASHAKEAAATTVRCALELTGARAAFVFLRDELGALAVVETAGSQAAALEASAAAALTEIAGAVVEEGRLAVHGPREAPKGLTGVAAVPLTDDRSPVGAVAVVHCARGRSFAAAQLDSLSTLAALASVSMHNADLRDAQRNFFAHVTDLLLSALDAHLGYLRGHAQRVAQYANRIGRALGLGEERMERLHFAALLHDIGMLKLDRSLQKSAKACAKHTVLGYRMLAPIRVWQKIAPIVHYHHERFDGSGYPEGLAGQAIPLESRIISVADAFDTMTSETSYKPPMSIADALRELEDGTGTQFDPTVVAAFRNVVDQG